MNMFRRIFNPQNPPSQPGDGTPSAAPAVSQPTPAANDHKTAELKESHSTAEATLPIQYPEGVTRPLSPDVLNDTPVTGHLVFAQATDTGLVRNNNQDAMFSFFASGKSAEERPDFGLFIVADGMGGHHDGEKASAMTARVVAAQVTSSIFVPLLNGESPAEQQPISESLVDAIQKANQEIVSKVPSGGTTLTTAVILGDLAYIAHVGDSRIYYIRETIEQLTRDHSLVQRLVELEQLTPDEIPDHPQRNVLYRALGQNENIEVDTITRRLPAKARLLLCSDGLWNQVEDHEIFEIVKHYTNPQEACQKLVALANDRGGSDNVTVVLLHLPG